jgi:hypothetical protein
LTWAEAVKRDLSDWNVLRDLGRGRSKLTWAEAVKRDLSDWNVLRDLAHDRTA